ncbi:MAG: hypothetical protein WCG66_09310 [bacterium]
MINPKKPASKILIHIGVRKFSGSQLIEEWDSTTGPSTKLSDKIAEYIMRLGDANSLCLNIVIQLLTRGKVRVDFRETSERLHLVNPLDIMSRAEAVQVFDHWYSERLSNSEAPDSTQRIMIELPQVRLPRPR